MPPLPAPKPLTLPDVKSLDKAVVRNNHELLAQIVQDDRPDVDVKQGALYNLLFYLSAVLTTLNQTVARRIVQSMSLAAVGADPELADDAIVDNLLSNYNLTRLPGAKASGPVQVILNAPAVVTIPKGAVFTAGTQTFTSDEAYTSRLSQATAFGDTDRLVTSLGAGTYGFNINVTAAESGAAANVRRGTRMVPAVSPSSNFVMALTLADFDNGAERETNTQLMAKQAAGAGLRAWSNRMTVDAVLRNQDAFKRVLGTSLIGFGDKEMVRDQHSLWPGSMGGRADLYVRTQERASSVVLPKTAVLVAITVQGGVWQFYLSRDEVPGFYEIEKVSQPGAIATGTGYAIQLDTRGYDMTAVTGVVPDVTTAAEAQYSRYATGTFQFLDAETPTTGLVVNTATKQYDVSVRYMPLVAQIQDFFQQRSVAAPAGDLLVRAPIPVFVTASFRVEIRAGSQPPSIPAIQEAVAGAVNRLSFGNRLTAAVIASAAAPLLTAGANLTQIYMTGRVRNVDNTTTNLTSSDALVPPADPGKPTTSERTTAYFLDPADVAVTVVTVTGPQV